MTPEKESNVVILCKNCLHHIGRADRLHALWSIVEHLHSVVGIVALVSALVCLGYLLATGELLVSYLTWCVIITGWFVFQLLVEWGIDIIRRRLKRHQLEANRLARCLEDMGFTRPIF